jgi:uncharacterized protein (DUF1810 family)
MTQDSPSYPFRLSRFSDAQDGLYQQVLAEIRAGHKQSHWMWFIFPQIDGLGFSETSRHFAIKSRAEAEAYLAHPVLGPRLRECAQAVLDEKGRTAAQIFGEVDAMKLRSSATLFAAVSPADSVFHRILAQYFDAETDQRTMTLLR